MKYLLGISLLITGIAFASPISYKGDAFEQVPCKKKKKKKKDCGCSYQYQQERKIEVF